MIYDILTIYFAELSLLIMEYVAMMRDDEIWQKLWLQDENHQDHRPSVEISSYGSRILTNTAAEGIAKRRNSITSLLIPQKSRYGELSEILPSRNRFNMDYLSFDDDDDINGNIVITDRQGNIIEDVDESFDDGINGNIVVTDRHRLNVLHENRGSISYQEIGVSDSVYGNIRATNKDFTVTSSIQGNVRITREED